MFRMPEPVLVDQHSLPLVNLASVHLNFPLFENKLEILKFFMLEEKSLDSHGMKKNLRLVVYYHLPKLELK